MAAHLKSIRILDHIHVSAARHAGENIDLALLDFLNDPNGSFFVIEVIRREFPSKPFTVVG